MGYQTVIPETEKQKLKIPDDIWERTKDISFHCVFHWLDCLYQDFWMKKLQKKCLAIHAVKSGIARNPH